MTQGPPISDIVTPFDDALVCMNGRIDDRLTFAVGGIPDATGRETNNGVGTGRYVTQAAGDIVQSALFKTGVSLVNRRDVGTTSLEAQWGLRELRNQTPAMLAITGSVNSLDFIPGAGAFINIGGVGPRYRQNRILVGLDLAMTNVATGEIVANIALHKQIHANEMGMMGTRFSGDNIIDVDFGGSEREATQYALRQMLQLGTFELLAQLMPPEEYQECSAMIDERYGAIQGDMTTGEQLRELEEQTTTVEPEAAAEEDGEGSGDAAG